MIGLYPLLPLMSGELGEKPADILNQSIEIICNIEDVALQKDLLAVMAIIAGGSYSKKLIYSLIRREMLMLGTIPPSRRNCVGV